MIMSGQSTILIRWLYLFPARITIIICETSCDVASVALRFPYNLRKYVFQFFNARAGQVDAQMELGHPGLKPLNCPFGTSCSVPGLNGAIHLI